MSEIIRAGPGPGLGLGYGVAPGGEQHSGPRTGMGAQLFDLDRLPAPPALRARLRALARLEAEVSDRPSTVWSDDPPLGPGARSESGSGDHVRARFWEDGSAFVSGFEHESPMSPWAREEPRPWPGLVDGLPERCVQVLEVLPDDEREALTLAVWWQDGAWRRGPLAPVEDDYDDPEGIGFLLGPILEGASSLHEHLAEVHAVDLPLETIERAINEPAGRRERPR